MPGQEASSHPSASPAQKQVGRLQHFQNHVYQRQRVYCLHVLDVLLHNDDMLFFLAVVSTRIASADEKKRSTKTMLIASWKQLPRQLPLRLMPSWMTLQVAQPSIVFLSLTAAASQVLMLQRFHSAVMLSFLIRPV